MQNNNFGKSLKKSHKKLILSKISFQLVAIHPLGGLEGLVTNH